MGQDRFMVIDKQKGVVIPLQADNTITISPAKDERIEDTKEAELEAKIHKIQLLIKALVKQSIKDTINEYNLQLTQELKEFENNEIKRWEKLEEEDAKRWDKMEERMEKHFKSLDRNIRQKQESGKRKKHSIF